MDFIYSGVLADLQYFFPILATIRSFVQSTISTGTPKRSRCCYINHIRISGINFYHSDMLRILQPHMLPAFATINGFVYSIAISHASLIVVFACSNPNHIVIVWIHRHKTDGVRAFVIKNRLKRNPTILRFPYST